MTPYCHQNHGRFMLLMNIVRYKALNTFKSKNDEQNNQALLKRLKNLSVIGRKKTLPSSKAKELIKGDVVALPERRLPFEKLQKLVSFYQSDPLTWNPSVLGRIFNIPEDYCSQLAIYVRPMVYWDNAIDHDEVQKLVKTTCVVDVARLKTDDNYLVTYKKIAFPEYTTGQSLPKKALPDYLEDRQREQKRDGLLR